MSMADIYGLTLKKRGDESGKMLQDDKAIIRFMFNHEMRPKIRFKLHSYLFDRDGRLSDTIAARVVLAKKAGGEFEISERIAKKMVPIYASFARSNNLPMAEFKKRSSLGSAKQ